MRGAVVTPPLGYGDVLHLMSRAAAVLTDSGGLQEETTVLGVPCVTIRENTERPITITEGTNVLAGTSRDGIVRGLREARRKVTDGTRTPEFWDGRAGERIVADIVRRCGGDRERRAVA